MSKYYRLKLNCARTKGNKCLEDEYNCGYISYLPVVRIEKSLFGKDNKLIQYNGFGYVIAEKKDNYFEDLVFGRRIDYNPLGIRNIEDLDFVSTDRLLNELNKGLTCFDFEEISVIEVANFIKQIQNNDIMIRRYKNELDYVSNKHLIKEEMDKRSVSLMDEEESLKIIDQFKKVRSL